MPADRDPPPRVLVDPQLRDLAADYLDKCRRTVDDLRAALDAGDFAALHAIGHNLHGSGGAYGFAAITRFGEAVEAAAAARDAAAIRPSLAAFADYVSRVEIAAAAPPPPPPVPRTILCVDDDPDTLLLEDRLLSRAGYRILTASDGAQALPLVKSSTPDLILMDVMMPGQNGYEACALLQQDPATAPIPVVFVTALGEEQDKARAFAAGGVDYLVKPVNRETLVATVARRLAERDRFIEIQRDPPVSQESRYWRSNFPKFKEKLAESLPPGADVKQRLARVPASALYEACREWGMDEASLADAVARFVKRPFVPEIDPKDVLLGVLPASYCRANRVVALSDSDGGRMFVLCNPFDGQLMDTLRSFPGDDWAVTHPGALACLFEPAPAAAPGAPADGDAPATPGAADAGPVELVEEADETADPQALAASAGQFTVIKVAESLIAGALRKGASDIHVEPREHRVEVRYRIDGILHDDRTLPKSIQLPLLSRFKIMANLNIAERRLPQDGRIRVRYRERHADLRVSTLPVRHGEKIVIRVLDTAAVALQLDSLGFDAAADSFRRGLARPHGIVLVTGPTGSGKTTTLYTAVTVLNQPRINIVTVEDPVEYEIAQVNQLQVHPQAGLTFPVALRAILRQDPNVILVGEIRDTETVDIAIKAALTGHLVLSTLHTNDAPAAVPRLFDMGMEPYLVSATLQMIVAQRLFRRLCTACRRPADVPAATLEQFRVPPPPDMKFYRPVGCPQCNGIGYKGREAAVEVAVVGEEFRHLIAASADLERLRRCAIESCGMIPLRTHAFLKAARGVTSIEEVLRVTG